MTQQYEFFNRDLLEEACNLTVSSICTQLDYFARVPKGCHNHAPIKTEKGNH